MPQQVRIRRLDAWVDPEIAFRLLGARASRAVWLDAGPDATSGRSAIAVGHDESAFVVADATDGDDLIDTLRSRLDERAAQRDDEGSSVLGWLGWFGYEWGAARLGVPVAATAVPDAAFLFADRAIVFDHARREVELEWLDGADADAWADDVAERLDGAAPAPEASEASEPGETSEASAQVEPNAPVSPSAIRWRHAPDAYAARIEACRTAITRGDAYQLCLTNRIDLDAPADALSVYLRLRRLSPAHHGGFVRFDDVALLSASPEQFLLVDRSGLVTTRPMKGTRPRGYDEASDLALRAELLASDKERAENLMIVDLMRNDLGRIAELGTVSVPELHVVEEYPQVHQLVSTVTARLRPGATALDAVVAAFPAGSMTGAPKHSAMTILHSLEEGPRGIYSGAFGSLSVDGSADLAMVIRSIVATPDGASIGTGGGITALSVADDEVEETRIKARALLQALLGRRSAAIE
ncbi:aminodeoxychorismate synthase component I [Agromyces intestinalis]|uniref:aminodeoxychorismate synthase n=1 Tax=Agromyces intestinalis TaxID=2592652 RepID=A0A5C1YAE9_9MICO|nr:aminodeoxychorismate synthase component I [Agromyces intestinalis]QEO13163.1 aminodeoxychorismate synthase component I [Agromyces intestinalis]